MYYLKRKTMMSQESKDVRELLHPTDYSKAMDLRGQTLGTTCVCGCEVFIALIAFDEYKEINFYFLDGECANCGSMVTLPYPNDVEPDCD
jgi:hypothetical protein